MKRILFVALALAGMALQAQTIRTFTQEFDSVMRNVNYENAATGIIYDRVVPFANLTNYNSNEQHPDTANADVFVQAYSELYRAAYVSDARFSLSVDDLNDYVNDDVINFPILFSSFNIIDTIVAQDRLYYDNDSIIWEDENYPDPLFLEKEAFITSPLKRSIVGTEHTFSFPEDLWFDLYGDIKEIYVDFGDGNGEQQIYMDSEIEVDYVHEGVYTIVVSAEIKGDTYYAYSTLKVIEKAQELSYPKENVSITSQISFTDYENHSAQGTAQMRVFYANSNRQLRKPILILDGFDPGDSRKIEPADMENAEQTSIWELLNYEYNDHTINIGDSLIRLGYDLAILNFSDGGGYIERNAMACIEAINRLNAKLASSGSNEQIVVVGPSMGGQIARYAIAYMEQNKNQYTNYGKHNCRLYISIDSPHKGANISLGAQAFLQFYGVVRGRKNAKDTWDNTLNCPAAKQMLIKQYNVYVTNNVNVLVNHDTKNNYFTTYYNKMNLIGYPKSTRNLSVINGSINGFHEDSGCNVALSVTSPLFKSTINLFPDNTNCYIFIRGNKKKVFAYPDGKRSIDAAPGGTYPTFDIIKNDSPWYFTVSVNESSHCFMPITSTLDITDNNLNYYSDVSNIDLVTTGKNPFDSYYGQIDKNMEHVTFDHAMVSYMINEIETYIVGIDSVDLCSAQTYSLHLPQNTTASVSWTCSDNMRIVGNATNNTVSVKALSIGEGYVKANVSSLTHNKEITYYVTVVNNDDTYSSLNDLTFASDSIVIHTTKACDSNFIIPSGKKLKISGTGDLLCADGVKIVVEQGGSLVVDGGTIEAYCDNGMWQGIEMCDGATVEMRNGARIEYAHNAIRTMVGDDWDHAGGTLKLDSCTFSNCRRAIEFKNCPPNANSYIKRVAFSVDDDNRFADNDTSFHAHVSAWASSVPEMRGCTFENLTGDMSGFGILALNSNVNVTRHLYAPNTSGSPHRACTFTGFGDAVSASNDASAGLTVQYAGFTNNICGIRAAGTSTTNLRFNSINLGTSTTSSTRYGIHVTSANAPYIGFNNIVKQLSAGNHVSGTGIYLNGCGTGFYQVADNTISYMQDGIKTVGNNSGLYIRCNTITNNVNGVSTSGYIHDPQGNISASAGNVFSGNTVDLNDSGYGYDYYYYGTAPSTNTFTGGGGGTPINKIGGGFSNPGVITLISASADGCSGGGGQPTKGGGGTQDNAPLGDLQQYLNYKGTAASATSLAERQSLESRMAELSAKALGRLASGTDAWKTDSLKMWYGAIDYPYAKYALAELHTVCGETAKADSIIAALPDMTVLSEDGYDEYASYLPYYSLYRTLSLSGRSWAEMTDGETQSLKMIAEQGFGKAKARARFILCFFGVECYTDGDGTQQQEDTEAVGNAMPAHHSTETGDGDREERNAARVHPNPTDGTLTVEADGIAEVTIYGTDGTKLAGKRIDGTATLDLSGLGTGIYFYEIRTDNGTVYGKLMKK